MDMIFMVMAFSTRIFGQQAEKYMCGIMIHIQNINRKEQVNLTVTLKIKNQNSKKLIFLLS